MSSTTVTKRAGGVLFEALTWLTTVCCLHVALVAIVLLSGSFAFAQTPSFTYQGRFTDGGTAANGVYDMQFKLFDSSSVGTGNQLGTTITNGAVAVVNGVFTVQLNFGGAVFSGPDRFLEIAVRAASSSDPYTVMSPRQFSHQRRHGYQRDDCRQRNQCRQCDQLSPTRRHRCKSICAHH